MADPEGPLPGGMRNQIGAKRRRERVREGIPPPLGGGPGGFLKNGCKGCILCPFFFTKFVLIFSPKTCV